MNEIVSKPLINEGLVYAVSTNGNISSIDRRNGRVIWTRDLSSYKNIYFDGFDIFVTHKSDSIYSLNKDSGEINWRLEDLQYRKLTSGVMLSDFFIEADFDGFIHVIDSQSGLIVGRSQIASGVKILDTLTVFKDKNVLGMTAEGEVLLIKFDQITQDFIEDNNLGSGEERNLEEEEVESVDKNDILDWIFE